MTVNEIRESVFENYYKGIGHSTESSYYLVKSLKTKRFIVLVMLTHLILLMLKNTISHFQESKTKNQ